MNICKISTRAEINAGVKFQVVITKVGVPLRPNQVLLTLDELVDPLDLLCSFGDARLDLLLGPMKQNQIWRER